MTSRMPETPDVEFAGQVLRLAYRRAEHAALKRRWAANPSVHARLVRAERHLDTVAEALQEYVEAIWFLQN
jgi:hypothetical protein